MFSTGAWAAPGGGMFPPKVSERRPGTGRVSEGQTPLHLKPLGAAQAPEVRTTNPKIHKEPQKQKQF